MRDRTVYELHSITGIFGPVKSVTGQSGIVVEERSFKDRTIKVTQDDNTVFILGWGGPFFGIVYVSEVMITLKSLQRFPGLGLFIKGSDGEIALGRRSVEIYSTRVPDGYQSVKTERLLQYIPPEHYKMEEAHVFNDVMHLVDCIIKDKAPIVFGNTLSINHARHVVEIIDKGYEAARTGKTQTLTSTF